MDEATAIALAMLANQGQQGRPSSATPGSAWGGVAGGMNTFVRNAIAANMYNQSQQRKSREEALAKLGMLSKIPGALRLPGAGPVMQEAGMPYLAGAPKSREEIEAEALERLSMDPRYRGLTPDMMKQQQEHDLAVKMLGQYSQAIQDMRGAGGPPELTGAPSSASPMPPGASPYPTTGRVPGAPPTIGGPPSPTMRTSSEEIGFSGGKPTLKMSTGEVARPGFAEGMQRYEIERLRTLYSEQFRSRFTPESINERAKVLGVTPDLVEEAWINDQIRGRGYSIPAEAPSQAKLAENKRSMVQLERDSMALQVQLSRLEVMAEQVRQTMRQGDIVAAENARNKVIQVHQLVIQEAMRQRSEAVRIGLESSMTEAQIRESLPYKMADGAIKDAFKMIGKIASEGVQIPETPELPLPERPTGGGTPPPSRPKSSGNRPVPGPPKGTNPSTVRPTDIPPGWLKRGD